MADELDLYEFRLADVGEGLHEAEIRKWLVEVGQNVAQDQEIVEVETDKAVVQLPAPVEGVVRLLGAREGETLTVGDVLAVIETESKVQSPASKVAAPERVAAGAVYSTTSGSVLATPAVRKLARDLGVDLAAVPGSGADGRILASDVEAFAKRDVAPPTVAQQPLPDPVPTLSGLRTQDSALADRRVPLRGLRRRIA